MTSRQDICIVHLLQVPEVAPVLARWFVEEWTPWYGPEGRGDAETDLAACRSRDTLPLCLVALTMDDAVLGTAALKAESVGSEIGAGPWLAAVLVGKDHQGRGVGTALVEAVEEEAARLGFESAYTSTDAAERILERRGWRAIGTTESIRGPATIYRRHTGAATAPE